MNNYKNVKSHAQQILQQYQTQYTFAYKPKHPECLLSYNPVLASIRKQRLQQQHLHSKSFLREDNIISDGIIEPSAADLALVDHTLKSSGARNETKKIHTQTERLLKTNSNQV